MCIKELHFKFFLSYFTSFLLSHHIACGSVDEQKPLALKSPAIPALFPLKEDEDHKGEEEATVQQTEVAASSYIYSEYYPDPNLTAEQIVCLKLILKVCTNRTEGELWRVSPNPLIYAIGVGSTTFITPEYLAAVKGLKIGEQLSGYIAHLLKTGQTEGLQNLFYNPDQKAWRDFLGVPSTQPLSSLRVLEILDQTRTVVYESLRGVTLSTDDIRFYFPAIFDWGALHLLLGSWGIEDYLGQQDKVTALFQRTIFSLFSYRGGFSSFSEVVARTKLLKDHRDVATQKHVADLFHQWAALWTLSNEYRQTLEPSVSPSSGRFASFTTDPRATAKSDHLRSLQGMRLEEKYWNGDDYERHLASFKLQDLLDSNRGDLPFAEQESVTQQIALVADYAVYKQVGLPLERVFYRVNSLRSSQFDHYLEELFPLIELTLKTEAVPFQSVQYLLQQILRTQTLALSYIEPIARLYIEGFKKDTYLESSHPGMTPHIAINENFSNLFRQSHLSIELKQQLVDIFLKYLTISAVPRPFWENWLDQTMYNPQEGKSYSLRTIMTEAIKGCHRYANDKQKEALTTKAKDIGLEIK